jgi:ribA/ribD-fused uncharacterized protein
MQQISEFYGQLRFLSNFWPCRVDIPETGIVFPSAEHAYQACKLPLDLPGRLDRFRQIAALPKASSAKAVGRSGPLRPDWLDVRVSLMRRVLLAKFADPALLDRLKATAPRELVEGNSWGDTFWGVCDGTGENHLGRLLMSLRDSL